MLNQAPGFNLLLTYQPVRMLNSVTSFHYAYEKLEKQSIQPLWVRPTRLLVRHLFSNSEVLGVLSHGIVVNMEDHMLSQFSLGRSL